MSRKWTTKMFSDYVIDNFDDEFEVKGEYVNNNTPILMYHKECGREFTIRPGNFKTRKRCSLCYGKFKKTTKQFKEEVFSLVGNEYEVLGEYETSKHNIKIKHVNCNHIYGVTPDDFLNGGNRCPNCAPNKPKTTKEFFEEVELLTDGEYELISEYEGSKTDATYIHHTCGTVFNKIPKLFLIGIRCPKCGLESRTGENHYRYNFELTEEERLRRDMFNGEIKKWRNKIYARDSYTCVICNSYGGKLNAHHLNSWDVHKEERFLMENGITLCEECHKDFHSTYGYGKNTKIQFELYRASL